MSNKSYLAILLYKHLEYHHRLLEDIHDQEQIQQSYNKWAEYCVITAITPTHIRIDLPSKSNGPLVSRYLHYNINAGLWLSFSDYGNDTEQYFWCRNRLTATIRNLLCRLTANGPYLAHIIQIQKTRKGGE